MNWYQGNIAEAVALSKTKNAIFVVYVEGKDEATTKLTNFINDTRIREKLESSDFVAIKIQGESEAYMQFASIFQIVPVPSIFFIGKAGTPLDIATGVLASVEELEGKITKVLQLAGKVSGGASSSAAAASSDFIRQEAKTASTRKVEEAKKEEEKKEDFKKEEEKEKDLKKEDLKKAETKKEASQEEVKECEEEIICKDGVCFKKPKESLSKEQEEVKRDKVEESKPQTSQEEEDKLAETRKYLEQKRRERIEEEKRLEKERELRRRKEGKEMQNLRAWQKDQELKELKENIKRERLEEQAARERIRAQIAADKAERAHKFAAETPSTSNQAANDSNTHKPSTANATASDESRLQFRLASGASNSHNFKCSTTLSEIRDYVVRELLPGTGIKEFTLATTYPKRELTNEHNTKTLLELELFPSAVILIIGKEATGPTAIISRNGGVLNMLTLVVMAILNPIFAIFSSAKNWLTGKGKDNTNANNNVQTGAQKRANEEENDVSKRRNLDRFLNVSGTGNTTGTSNPQDDNSPGTSNQTGAYRRYVGGSNIHRLSDNRKDSDDENATWNGNSTQQQ